MISGYHISEPYLLNPLKHHLGFIREFIYRRIDKPPAETKELISELKHLGSSVMDVYTGELSVRNICDEVEEFLKLKDLDSLESYSNWVGTNTNCFRIISLSDGSMWTLKYFDNNQRYVHIFPARSSQHTFRVKSNALKSALIYYILIGKDLVTGDDLNKVRLLLGLSPIKDSVDTMAIHEMIDILRDLTEQ